MWHIKVLPRLLPGMLIAILGCRPHSNEVPRTNVLVEKSSVALGSFTTSSGILVSTDPAYDLQTAGIPGLGAVLEKCKQGTWMAVSIQKKFNKDKWFMPSELVVHHESCRDWTTLKWEEVPKGVGADTAQVGIWDREHFSDDTLVPKDKNWINEKGEVTGPWVPEQMWYSWCCELTSGGNFAAVMPYGVVSRSGYGDGGYPLFVSRNVDGLIIAVLVRFVDDNGCG